MSIEFTCPHCQSLLRVDDANAGKRARCPHCSVINRIPGERTETPPAPPVSHQFFIDSVSGQTFGPVNKAELEQWVTEGRISAACVIRATGEKSGQPATVYFPALRTENPLSGNGKSLNWDESPTQDSLPLPGESGSVEFHDQPTTHYDPVNLKEDVKPDPTYNPYAPPSPVDKPYQPQGPVTREGITPTEADLGEVFTRTNETYMKNIGLLFGVGVVCGVVQLTTELVTEMGDRFDGFGVLLGILTILILNLIQLYLVIGQTRISLKLVRGEQAEFSELFNGGDKFLATIGFTLLIIIPLFLGFLFFIVPGVFLLLYFWPSYTLIVDNKTTVMDSFDVARRIGERNLLNSFVLGIAGMGILLLGVMLCLVGGFFAIGYVSVLWATAYLLMSGQVASRAR